MELWKGWDLGLQRVGFIVCDIGEPCLFQSSIQIFNDKLLKIVSKDAYKQQSKSRKNTFTSNWRDREEDLKKIHFSCGAAGTVN